MGAWQECGPITIPREHFADKETDELLEHFKRGLEFRV